MSSKINNFHETQSNSSINNHLDNSHRSH